MRLPRLANRCGTANEFIKSLRYAIDSRDANKSDQGNLHPLSNCLPGPNLREGFLYIHRKLGPVPNEVQ